MIICPRCQTEMPDAETHAYYRLGPNGREGRCKRCRQLLHSNASGSIIEEVRYFRETIGVFDALELDGQKLVIMTRSEEPIEYVFDPFYGCSIKEEFATRTDAGFCVVVSPEELKLELMEAISAESICLVSGEFSKYLSRMESLGDPIVSRDSRLFHALYRIDPAFPKCPEVTVGEDFQFQTLLRLPEYECELWSHSYPIDTLHRSSKIVAKIDLDELFTYMEEFVRRKRHP